MDRRELLPWEQVVHDTIKRATSKSFISPTDGPCGPIDDKSFSGIKMLCYVMIIQMITALFVAIGTLDASVKGGEQIPDSEHLGGWIGYSVIVIVWNCFLIYAMYTVWDMEMGKYQYDNIKAEPHISQEWYDRVGRRMGKDYQPVMHVMRPSDAKVAQLLQPVRSNYYSNDSTYSDLWRYVYPR
jgi:hypothetical protein